MVIQFFKILQLIFHLIESYSKSQRQHFYLISRKYGKEKVKIYKQMNYTQWQMEILVLAKVLTIKS